MAVYAVSLQLEGLRLNALLVLADEQGDEIVLGRIVLNRLRILLDGPAGVLGILAQLATTYCKPWKHSGK